MATATVISQDGTRITFEPTGHGPPVVFVVGAFNDRSTGAALADALATDFTTVRYDRRGRGDSGDTAPYAIDREIEDLRAIIDRVGGAAGAAVFGFSSGAALALLAAARGAPVTRLALYDLPLVTDGPLGRARREAFPAADHAARLAELVAASRRGDAVEYFQARVVGLPEPLIAQFRRAPFRPGLEAIAHTLIYDATLIGDGGLPTDLSAVRAPTLALAGGAAPPFMRETADAVAAALRDGRSLTLDGATHDLTPALAAPLTAFLAEPA
jgi:dienelactone hydrolase